MSLHNSRKPKKYLGCKRSLHNVPDIQGARQLCVVAQVIGLVGSSRKRTLMLWQAVELSRMMQRPDLATLQIARKALEPPDDPLEQVCCP